MAGESQEVCFADRQVGESVVLCIVGEGTLIMSLVCLRAHAPVCHFLQTDFAIRKAVPGSESFD